MLLELGSDPCHRNRFAYQPYYVAQEWNYWETAEMLIEAMGHKYQKLEPFTYPRAPRGSQVPKTRGAAQKHRAFARVAAVRGETGREANKEDEGEGEVEAEAEAESDEGQKVN